MKYLSVCSGIEAATRAWAPLGWKPVAFSEIEPFPCSVLKHHYPDVPNWGDMTRFEEWPDEEIDLLCGGTPCQSFSIAGLRAGLADPRGNLMLTFGAIAAKYRPSWLVWENVPGVLSSNGGRDFASFLGLITGQTIPHQKWKNSGIVPGIANAYGVAWRVLDAQYVRVGRFGRAIPQRRRRVFVVGYIGDWRRAAAVLFDRESLCGYPAPRRQAGEGFAGGFETGPGGGGFTDVAPTMDTRAKDGPIRNQLGVGVMVTAPVAPTLNAHFGSKQGLENQHVDGGCGSKQGLENQHVDGGCGLFVAHALRGEGFGASEDGTGRGTPLVPVVIQEAATRENPASGPDGIGVKQDGSAYTIEARPVPQAVAFDLRGREGGSMPEGPHHTASVRAASGGSSRSYVAQPYAVRRLTPTECERLMGFPDNFTAVPHRGKPAADGPRYKSLGNSWAVNCAAWIGERIAMVTPRSGLTPSVPSYDRHRPTS